MKKYISAFALSALVCSSCSDFLDVQPEGDATTTQYFTNDQQAIDAIDGLYERFHQEGCYGRELFWEQGAACDVVWGRTRGYPTLATLNYTGDESPLRDVFSRMYSTMSRANWVIDCLLDKEATTTLTEVEKRSLGEAYFNRAWAHFIIAYRYGTDKQGVPFVRYEDFENGYDNSIPPQRASVMENYQLIIDDMDKAISYLPRFEEYDADNRGRAHDAAAVAFKAKTYAYWATWESSQWNKVIEMVNLLETSYGRELAATFAELFSSDFADFWNAEYLWTIPGNGGSTGGGSEFPGVILENKGWGVYNGWGQNKPSLDLYEEMAKDGAGNDRLVRTILEYGQEFQYFGETRRFYSEADLEAGFMINKYMDPFKHANAAE
ncbi:MAG: RagB/SusD family nutrient uptake outer membrane protein, partial [Bacteroides sp.]|nr:RagB/SusD family nutrient uptake outer membrane protein [Bacteroides sp.]